MRILITGSTGFIGLNLIQHLHAEGHHITAIIRNPEKSSLIEKHADSIIIGDLKEPDSLKKIFKGTEICFHLSGLTKSVRLKDFWENNYTASINLIEEIKRTDPPIKHLIMLSSLAASSPCSSEEGVGEGLPEKPVSAYGQSKLSAELYLRKTALPYTIIRPPIVYGPYDRDVFSFFKMAKLGFIPVMGAKKKYSVIYVGDLACILSRIMGKEAAFGKIYNVGEPQSYTYGEIISAICRAVGRRSTIINIPEFLLYIIAPVYELLSRITGISPILTRDKLLEIVQDGWTSDTGLISRELGITAQTTIEAGTKMAFDWYKLNGWL